jgi:hypothetical protein
LTFRERTKGKIDQKEVGGKGGREKGEKKKTKNKKVKREKKT